MHPRVVLITDPDSSATRPVWNALDSAQCWIITPPRNKLWLLEEQLKLADAVVVVVDRWLIPSNVYEEFRHFIHTIRKHQAVRPQLQAFALVEQNVDLRIQLTGFITITYVQAPSDHDLERVVESIREGSAPYTSDAGPGLAELLEGASLQRERLDLIASRSIVWPIVGLVAAATIAVLGLALCIPRVLSRWELSNAWLSIGPVLFVAGGLATIYLVSRTTREGEKRQMARFLARRLEAVIDANRKHIETASRPQNTVN